MFTKEARTERGSRVMNTIPTRSSRTVGPRDKYTEVFRLSRPALAIARFTYLLSIKVAMYLGRLRGHLLSGHRGKYRQDRRFCAQAMADDLKANANMKTQLA